MSLGNRVPYRIWALRPKNETTVSEDLNKMKVRGNYKNNFNFLS